MKFPLAVFALVSSLSAFGFQIECKAKLNGTGFTELKLVKPTSGTATFEFRQRGNDGQEFMKTLTRQLPVVYRPGDEYVLKISEAKVRAEGQRRDNPLVGFSTFGDRNGIDATLEHRYVRHGNRYSDEFPFKAEVLNLKTVHMAKEDFSGSFRQLDVELLLASEDKATARGFVAFTPSHCKVAQ